MARRVLLPALIGCASLVVGVGACGQADGAGIAVGVAESGSTSSTPDQQAGPTTIPATSTTAPPSSASSSTTESSRTTSTARPPSTTTSTERQTTTTTTGIETTTTTSGEPKQGRGEIDPSLWPLIDRAVEDLSARLSVPFSDITVQSARLVQWSDESLGCPEPGMLYTQALVDGSAIELIASAKTYWYHSGGSANVFLCTSPDRQEGTKAGFG